MLDYFIVESILTEDYPTAQVNVEILKRYREQVLLMKPAEGLQTRPEWPAIVDSVQVSLSCLVEESGLQ